MIKKIALITLFGLFASILIYGAVNRTTARTELTKHSQTENSAVTERQSLGEQNSFGQGQGNHGQGQSNHGQGQAQGNQGQGQGQGNQGQGQGQGNQGQGQGQGNQGQGNQGQTKQGQAQGAGGQGQGQGRLWQEKPEQVTIAGTVIQAPELGVDMIVETDDGEVLVGTGPGYLAEQGFVIAAGDQVSVAGFWENEAFKAVTITLAADGKSIVLRDEWGRPLWSGAGRNAQNRQKDQNDF